MISLLSDATLRRIAQKLYPAAAEAAAHSALERAQHGARGGSSYGQSSVAGDVGSVATHSIGRQRSGSTASDITISFGVRLRFRRVRKKHELAAAMPITQDGVELMLLVCLVLNWRLRRRAAGTPSLASDAVLLPKDYVASFTSRAGWLVGVFVIICAVCLIVCSVVRCG